MKRTLLVVEDDPDHLAILQHTLRKCADRIASIELAETMSGTLHRLEAGGIDLVLLDLTLPDSALQETVAHIPDLTRFGAAIVALSSLDAPDIARCAIESGARAFLAKHELNEASVKALLDGLQQPSATASKIDVAAAPMSSHVEIASRLNHDLNSILASALFRSAALRADPAVAAAEHALAHLDAIDRTVASATNYAQGARMLVADAQKDIQPESIALAAWVRDELPDVLHGIDVAVDARGLPQVRADDDALAHVFAILASNATRDGATATLTLRPGSTPATVEVTDDGGAWENFDPRMFGVPTANGRRDKSRPGLGHFRLVRWMQRLGGSAELFERADVPGAYGIRLHFEPEPPRV